MDEIVKRLSDLSSRFSSRFSSVGRVRLVVGLVVVLFFAWLVTPVFHGLVMEMYVARPFLLSARAFGGGSGRDPVLCVAGVSGLPRSGHGAVRKLALPHRGAGRYGLR